METLSPIYPTGSHKRRDKRCHIAGPLLRAALHTTLSKHGITIDETGSSLTHLTGPPLEQLEGTDLDREVEVGKRISEIPGVLGGDGGEVGIFNINHLGGHRYAGVMIVCRVSRIFILLSLFQDHSVSSHFPSRLISSCVPDDVRWCRDRDLRMGANRSPDPVSIRRLPLIRSSYTSRNTESGRRYHSSRQDRSRFIEECSGRR